MYAGCGYRGRMREQAVAGTSQNASVVLRDDAKSIKITRMMPFSRQRHKMASIAVAVSKRCRVGGTRNGLLRPHE
jgi:hypothetical protein